ncbi:MAG: flagellar hook-length control protein FliK [Deltaproteobacteria bacterium]|nr:flagellar hook-length control protein FliK [Deltaproteobacteria bacterium]
MEISLEPAGLGKLDIELNLNQDRLQGQIMVNDKAGKELIERNLPQLLSDLAREGLQVGGFSVSLKHQGRDQNPVLTRTEFEEPTLKPVSPEKMVPIQGNHLIHIIV